MKLSVALMTQLILPFILLSVSVFPNSVSAIDINKTYQNIITFGDSLTDTGNNDWVNSEGVIGAPITSIRSDTSGDKRDVWLNYFVERFKLRAHKQIELSRDTDKDPAHENVNYAYASALTNDYYVDDTNPLMPFFPINLHCETPGHSNADGTACIPGMLKQLDQYLSDMNHEVGADTIFVLWGGGNDIFNALGEVIAENGGEIPELNVIVDHATIAVNTAIENIRKMINKLVDNGASEEQIVVFDMPNLGIAPAAVGHEVLLSAISQGFNIGLQTQIAAAFPQVSIFSPDSILSQILDDPSSLNLEIDNTTGDCVADGHAPECKGYLFFNAKHPTTQIHEAIARILEKENNLVN